MSLEDTNQTLIETYNNKTPILKVIIKRALFDISDDN